MKALAVLVCSAVVVLASVSVIAHQETFKGTVLSTAATAVTVNVVNPKTKAETATTYSTSEKTRILRGDAVVTFAAAKIQKGENIAVTVDHDVDVKLALVIRLDAPK